MKGAIKIQVMHSNPAIHTNFRPSVKRKQWTNKPMKADLKSIIEGQGINKAAGDIE